jgi:hypothetical protein
MPLYDHFRPPVRGIWPWSSIHSAWATFISQQLNQKPLPAGYYALPHVHFGGQAQVDVATLEGEEAAQAGAGDGAVATAVWAPPRPPLVVPIDFADLDVFEVQVVTDDGLRLVAAIELVSPANKDRPSHRRAFAAKCAGYLQQGVGLAVVDVITERHENLHAELMNLFQLGEAAAGAVAADLYAVAYRTTGAGPAMRLEAWPAPLTVGSPLPLLPLWIGPELAVPLELDASYTAACESLRIPPAGPR